MKKERFLAVAIFVVTILVFSSMASASPGADILYQETSLGNGLWQYDYTFHNTSTADESLFSVYLYFTQQATVSGGPLPTGWDGIVWAGTNTTDVIDTFSTEPFFDIAAGNSLAAFSFTVDHRAGNIAYDAFLSGDNIVSGTTAPIVPEPISSVLYITGGSLLAGISYLRKRRRT